MTISIALPDYDRLLALLYQGPLEATPWQNFLPQCRQLFDAKVISLTLRSPAVGDRGVILNQLRPQAGSDSAVSVQLADQNDWAVLAYREQFFALDPFVNLPLGKVVTLRELMPDSELLQSEYYRHYLEPIAIRHILGADIGALGAFQARLRLGRAPGEKPFDEEDKALCAMIVPHLERAIDIHARLNRMGSERDLFAGAVEQLAVGTILLDEHGKFLHANQLATQILDERDGIQIANQQLELANNSQHREFKQAVQRALDNARNNRPAIVHALRVQRPSAKPDLGLMLRLVPQYQWAEGQHAPALAIFISDPGQVGEPSQQILAQLFGFTRAEAALAAQLNRGLSIQEAAAALQVSPHTARTQLKSIFAKTGVSRQAELVRLLVKSVASMG
ncbi:MAG TPA: helix-turn-helix transcriptional regulator [Spongiibacteraceae bacterium]